ncbi:hypothetical protein [Paenarthrobacter aromaticivorans]|uniref:Uncharacterized protein n=1 Tax=Paenarthrobacter aromaticivorans TaxID=2849150 RepID=A0ABS6I1W7_9MICC|nr:hypothetical protein [Paenarthrobacter sp. MMS21-TAE1-1]MBU8865649.1 hypothetical protein [Paenarthrobacter sp. MMS21-TAE1-1]
MPPPLDPETATVAAVARSSTFVPHRGTFEATPEARNSAEHRDQNLNAKPGVRRRVDDWTSVDGAAAEVLQKGQTLARGVVDGVTSDGAIAWVHDDTGRRRLYERSESFEIWVTLEDVGLNYKVNQAIMYLPVPY